MLFPHPQNLSELVENIKNKKLSSTDVTKAFIERSEKSKELNAYITEDFTSALDKAKKEAEKYSKKALNNIKHLKNSEYKIALQYLLIGNLTRIN